MSKNVVGLDIGNQSLKVAYRKRKVGIVTGIFKLPENYVKNGRIPVLKTMADSIKKLRKEYRLPRSAVYALSLPESAVICRRMTLPYMSREQLELNLPYEFKDFVSGDGDKYYYDYALERIVRDDEGTPKSLEVFAAAVLKNVVAEYRDLFRMCGLKLRILQPREIIWNTLLNRYIGDDEERREKEFCIVDMGYQTTRVMFYRGSTFRASRTIELGGFQIDEAIAQSRHVDLHLAQAYREADHEGVLEEEICVAAYRRIGLEIRRAINFYRFSEPDHHLEDLYFGGGSSNIAPLRDEIAELCDLSMHSVNELFPANVTGSEAHACAVAVGLSLCGKEVLENV